MSKTSNSNQLPKVEFQDIVAGQGRLDSNFIEIYDDRKGIVFRPGNILYGKLRPYLKNWLLVDFKGKAIGDFWVFEENNSNSRFIYYLIQTNHYQRIANDTSGTKMPRSDWNKVSNSSFFIPTTNEQELIGQLFKLIDYTLTLHQRKLDRLKNLKKAYLQQMFPKKFHSVPKLRFKNFSKVWDQRKLSEITERVSGNDGRMSLPTLTISASSGWLDQRERFSGNIAGKEQKNYTLLSHGELSYNKGNSKIAQYGVVFVLNNYKEALVPRVYHSFKVNEYSVPYFIQYLFETKLPDRELRKIISSGARMDGLLNISYSDFIDINVSIPVVKEQSKISSFLQKFNKNINYHQRKINSLKELKNSYLQLLFI